MRPSLHLLLLASLVAPAHELEDNRATVVLREPNHLTLTLYLAYPELLHRALAPDRPFAEFLLAASAAEPAALDQQLRAAHARFEAGLRVEIEPGLELAPAHWSWPAAAQLQQLLRQRAMENVTGAGHAHPAPLEVHAELRTPRPVTALRLRFPPEFRRVLVVAYRPTQAWAQPGALSPRLSF